MGFIIRDLTTYDEMLAVHHLQLEIWGQSDPTFAVYPPIMNTAAKNGGVVLGAFDDESDQMVAFLFSFLGREGRGPYKLCSQVMGVHQAWRQLGIAEALKQTQRRRAIAQGLPLITWTFDPLEGPNAHLNLHKLKAISRVYWRDVYGSNFGTLNVGLPTDRLLVEWWIQGRRLEQPLPPIPPDAPAIFTLTDTLQIAEANLNLKTETLWLEIPADIHAVKAISLELALDWRLQVRHAFENYLAQGYLATDFVSTFENGRRRNRYLLQKNSPALLAEIGCME